MDRFQFLLLLLIVVLERTSYSVHCHREPTQTADTTCRLPTTVLSRSHQLQQVLHVLDQVRLQRQLLSDSQLFQLAKQLRQLLDCIRVSRKSLKNGNRKPASRPYLSEYDEHGGVWSRHDLNKLSKSDYLGNSGGAGSETRQRVGSYGNEISVDESDWTKHDQHESLKTEHMGVSIHHNEENNSVNDRQRTITYSDMEENNFSIKHYTDPKRKLSPPESNTDFQRDEEFNHQSLHSKTDKTRNRNKVVVQNGQTTKYTFSGNRRQNVPPGFVATPPSGPVIAVGSGEANNGVNFDGSGSIMGFGGSVVPLTPQVGTNVMFGNGNRCRCLSRSAMLGLIVAGVSATALTAYISALFQRKASGSPKQQRTLEAQYRSMSMSAVQAVCALGHDISPIGPHWSLFDKINWSEIDNTPGNQFVHGNSSQYILSRGKRHVNSESRDIYNAVRFNFMDAPMRKSAKDPGPMSLFKHHLTNIDDGYIIVEKPRDVFKKYSTYIHDKNVLNLSSNETQSANESEEEESTAGLQTVETDKIDRHDSINGIFHEAPRHDQHKMESSLDGSTQLSSESRNNSSGTLPHIQEEIFQGSETDTSSSLFKLVYSLLSGTSPDAGLGPFQGLLEAYRLFGRQSESSPPRGAKHILNRPMKIISNFFFTPKRKTGGLDRCGCVTLDSKQLGAVGSPAQALVMSGVVLGYVLLQTMAVYGRRGRSQDNIDIIVSMLTPLISSEQQRLPKETRTSQPQSNEQKLTEYLLKMLQTVGNEDNSMASSIKALITTPSINCSRYHMCELQHQGALMGEPISVVTPLLRLPLSWILARKHNQNKFTELCSENGEEDCGTLRHYCSNEYINLS